MPLLSVLIPSSVMPDAPRDQIERIQIPSQRDSALKQPITGPDQFYRIPGYPHFEFLFHNG